MKNDKETIRPVGWGTPRLDRDGELIFVGKDELLVRVGNEKVTVIKAKNYKAGMEILSIGSEIE